MIYAIGAFDGFHAGHRALLQKAQSLAHAQNCGWGVITFDQNPQFLLSDAKFKQLFSDTERDFFARCIGVPKLIKLAFTKEFATLSPLAFLKLLEAKYDMTALVVGENFRFGKGRTGDVKFLEAYFANCGKTLEIVPSVLQENAVLCSTALRTLLTEGKIARVNSALDFAYMLSGTVVHGASRGKTLGFPTANIQVDENKVYPRVGSYVSMTLYEGNLYPSVTNIGFNPTFECGKLSCETHIIDFEGDLYGKKIMLFLLQEHRAEIKFKRKEELTRQLKIDVQTAKTVNAEFMAKNCDLISKIKATAFDMAGLV